jgi:hypothetical protein
MLADGGNKNCRHPTLGSGLGPASEAAGTDSRWIGLAGRVLVVALVAGEECGQLVQRGRIETSEFVAHHFEGSN